MRVGGHPAAARRLLGLAVAAALIAFLPPTLSGGARSADGPSAGEAVLGSAFEGPAPELVAPVVVAGASPTPTSVAGAVTVSPEPGSRTADPRTQISFLGRPAAELGTVTVVGSRSGAHSGSLRAYSTGDGASFVPDRRFVQGETVTVTTSLPIVGARDGTFTFEVARLARLVGPVTHPVAHTGVPGVDHFQSAPTLEPPRVQVGTGAARDLGGDFLLAPKGSVGQPGTMIVAPSGRLLWFRAAPPGEIDFDLNEQRYLGRPVLTYFQGRVVHGHGEGEGVILDSAYRQVAVVRAGNGVEADLHELRITPQSTAIVTAYRTMRWNCSAMGGATDGTVFDGVVQEIDVRTGLVMEEWDSLDHVPITASDFPAPKAASSDYDYFHINGIQLLDDGDLLVSSRNASAAYEVDPADDGAVFFTLGGKQPSATMGPGTQFFFQHDVRLHPGGLFSVFDNGAAPDREQASRALFLRVDPAGPAVSLVAAVTHPGVLATALGDVQVLPDGRFAVGWGTAPYYSLYSSSGTLLYDAWMPTGDDSYRAFLRAWTGSPASPPALAIVGSGASRTAYVSWNGATDVAGWRLLVGPSAGALRAVASVSDGTFETAIPFSVSGGGVAEVVALSKEGKVLGSSPPQSLSS